MTGFSKLFRSAAYLAAIFLFLIVWPAIIGHAATWPTPSAVTCMRGTV